MSEGIWVYVFLIFCGVWFGIILIGIGALIGYERGNKDHNKQLHARDCSGGSNRDDGTDMRSCDMVGDNGHTDRIDDGYDNRSDNRAHTWPHGATTAQEMINVLGSLRANASGYQKHVIDQIGVMIYEQWKNSALQEAEL